MLTRILTSLSTSITTFYATELSWQSKQKIEIGLSKVLHVKTPEHRGLTSFGCINLYFPKSVSAKANEMLCGDLFKVGS